MLAAGDGQVDLPHAHRLDGFRAIVRWRPVDLGSRELNKLSLGDWVGATGEVVRTRTGELSVRVAEWVLLAEAHRSFGDKWRGISDVETRYRQRYADLWANPGARQVLLLRSRTVSALRRFLEARGFVEVETPVFHGLPGGATARPFVTHHNALDMDLYLRIALGAAPQAAGRRGDRESLRDRAGVPQRGPFPAPQPRVHHARAVPGVRRLPRHDGPHRGRWWPRWRRR